MVEGGPTIAASFLSADLIDEVALFRSPRELGEGIERGFEGLPPNIMMPFVSRGIEQVGEDTLQTFERM